MPGDRDENDNAIISPSLVNKPNNTKEGICMPSDFNITSAQNITQTTNLQQQQIQQQPLVGQQQTTPQTVINGQLIQGGNQNQPVLTYQPAVVQQIINGTVPYTIIPGANVYYVYPGMQSQQIQPSHYVPATAVVNTQSAAGIPIINNYYYQNTAFQQQIPYPGYPAPLPTVFPQRISLRLTPEQLSARDYLIDFARGGWHRIGLSREEATIHLEKWRQDPDIEVRKVYGAAANIILSCSPSKNGPVDRGTLTTSDARELEKLRDEINKMAKSLGIETDGKNIDDILKDLKKKISDLQKSTEEIIAKIDKDIRIELNIKDDDDISTVITKFTEGYNKLKDKIKDLERDIEHLKHQIVIKDQKIAQLEQKIKDMGTDNKDGLIEKLRKEIEDLRRENQELRKILNLRDLDLDDLRSRLRITTDSLTSLKTADELSKTEIKNLQKRLMESANKWSEFQRLKPDPEKEEEIKRKLEHNPKKGKKPENLGLDLINYIYLAIDRPGAENKSTKGWDLKVAGTPGGTLPSQMSPSKSSHHGIKFELKKRAIEKDFRAYLATIYGGHSAIKEKFGSMPENDKYTANEFIEYLYKRYGEHNFTTYLRSQGLNMYQVNQILPAIGVALESPKVSSHLLPSTKEYSRTGH